MHLLAAATSYANTRFVQCSLASGGMQLLTGDASTRMSATQAADHPWLDPRSTAPARRRASRAEVAHVTAERAANTVQRLQARVKPSSVLGHMAAMKSPAAAEAGLAANNTLSELAQVVKAMSAEVAAARKEMQHWDKVEADENKAAGVPGESYNTREPTTAVRKAEEALRLAEHCAGLADASVQPATATVDEWERAIARQARASAFPSRGVTATPNATLGK